MQTGQSIIEQPVVAPTVVARQSNPVHVLFLVDQICEMGGAEKILMRTIRLLPRDRFRCSVVTFKINSRLPLFDDFPCPLTILPMSRTYGLSGARVALRLRALIRSEQVQIVHTFFETADLWGSLIAKLSGNPVLISSRRDMGIMRSRKHDLAYRLLGGVFDEVQTVSEEVRQFCIKSDRLDPHRVKTLYNGVALGDDPDLNNSTNKPPVQDWLKSASHVITAVGHIRPVKGYDVLIRTAATVCRSYPRAVFLIAGEVHDAGHYSELTQLCKSLNVTDNVRFLGHIDNVRPLLEASNVFCLLSRSEGLSNSLLEAMAAALPCVATRVGGNPELIEHGRSGYLINNEDHLAAAQLVLRLLDEPHTALAMGHRGRQVVAERFNETAMIEQLVRSYERLLSDRRL